jgi:hypothetical protein
MNWDQVEGKWKQYKGKVMNLHKGPGELDSPRSFGPRRGLTSPLRGILLRSRTLLLYLKPIDWAHSSTGLGFLEVCQISRVKAGHF